MSLPHPAGLINGSEECVDVGVRDGRVSCHERMFSFSP